MNILGINAFHGDSSACIVKDGQLIASVEEERFCRIKHWAGFPRESVRYCFDAAGVGLGDLNAVAVNRRPTVNLWRKILFVLSTHPNLRLIWERVQAAKELGDVPQLLVKNFAPETSGLKARFFQVEHHRAHLASSFLVSPFERAALLSVDGFGDFLSTMGAIGDGNHIRPLMRVFFPHSLGLFYTAITQWLGFKKYGDEYKVMGLAALGKPKHLELMRQIIRYTPDGFALNLDYFVHHKQSLSLTWGGEEPSLGQIYSDKLEQALGPSRAYEERVTEYHADIAASLQARYEEIFFRLLNRLYELTQIPRLCLAGGCALNSVANGKIFDHTPFREIYIQPAAYDAGGAIGAAFYVYHAQLGHKRNFIMKDSYWGPEFSIQEIETALTRQQGGITGCRLRRFDNEDELVKETAGCLASGKIVGWFQGRMEWGPRALGNRSILVDPRNPQMKDILNSRIKRREPFRPFAPSVLLEATGDYFEKDYPDPFMLMVYPIRPEKRALLPAVTHVDGTGRLQTVTSEENPLYHKLIEAFAQITGVPIILNTSFNENEPIVCTPDEALDCFLRTRMDVLVLGPFILERQ